MTAVLLNDFVQYYITTKQFVVHLFKYIRNGKKKDYGNFLCQSLYKI